MANFRQIHVSIWKDAWFLDLEPQEKTLFIYMITNESTNLAGLYKIAFKVICFETGLEKEFVSNTLDKFSRADKVYYMDGVAWVVNLRKYHETTSSKVQTRILRNLHDIPDCELKIRYTERNIPHIYPIPTLSLIEEEEEVYEKEQENKTTTAAAVASFHSHTNQTAQKLYTETTNQFSIPSDQIDKALHALTDIIDYYNGDFDGALVTCKAKFAEWCSTKGQSGKTYSPLNTNWLNWVLAELVPRPDDPDKDTRTPEQVWEEKKEFIRNELPAHQAEIQIKRLAAQMEQRKIG